MSDDNIIETTAVVLSSNNTLTVTKQSLDELAEKRKLLKEFIRGQMVRDVDYGLIPGCGDKPSLFLPGAEKLCLLFQLRDEYELVFKEIDIKNNFVMLSYKCSLFHIPSGKKISELEAFASSQEKKYAEKTEWTDRGPGQPKTKEKVPQNVSDIINTLSKMCQKRAYVGCTKKATGASDYFTSDIDDVDDATQNGLKPEMKGALNFLVDGNTMENKDKLKGLGGRWDGAEKKWRFSNVSQSTMEKVKALPGLNIIVDGEVVK